MKKSKNCKGAMKMVMKDYDKYKGEKYSLFVVALTQGGLVYVVDEKDKELMHVARIKRIFVLSPDETDNVSHAREFLNNSYEYYGEFVIDNNTFVVGVDIDYDSAPIPINEVDVLGSKKE